MSRLRFQNSMALSRRCPRSKKKAVNDSSRVCGHYPPTSSGCGLGFDPLWPLLLVDLLGTTGLPGSLVPPLFFLELDSILPKRMEPTLTRAIRAVLSSAIGIGTTKFSPTGNGSSERSVERSTGGSTEISLLGPDCTTGSSIGTKTPDPEATGVATRGAWYSSTSMGRALDPGVRVLLHRHTLFFKTSTISIRSPS